MEHKWLARRPLGNPRRHWRQDNFVLHCSGVVPISTALEPESPLTVQKIHRAVKTTIDAGFNLMGCLWSHPDTAMEAVRAAERWGGNILYQNLKRFSGMNERIFCETNDYMGAIRDTKQWKCIGRGGYFMWDEPILPETFSVIRKMIDDCERECPGVLPFTVANPSYNPRCSWEKKEYAPYIDRFLDEIEPCQAAFDHYPIGVPWWKNDDRQLDDSTMWSDIAVVSRAAAKRDIPFWFTYQAHHYPWHAVPYTFKHTMARCMAHAGILNGAKGVEAYVEWDGWIDPRTGGKGTYFEEQKQLNSELAALGNTLMALTCLRVIHDETLLPDHPSMEGLRTPASESELLDGSPLPARISVSEHTDAYGNRYLMVLNRDYDVAQHISLTLKNPSHIYGVRKDSGEQELLYENTTWFWTQIAPGDLQLYRIQPAEETPFLLDYYLDK